MPVDRAPKRCFRRLTAADTRSLRSHFLRLDPDDLLHRFMGARHRLHVDRYVRTIDWRRAVLVGCFIGRSLRGVGELHALRPPRAELAFTVERRFQRRGVGHELLRRTLLLARNRGLTALELRCRVDNERVRRLIRDFDGKITLEPMEAQGTIRPLPPTALTIATEMIEEAGLVGDALIKLWLDRPWRRQNWPGRCWLTPDLFTEPERSAEPSPQIEGRPA